MTTLLEMGKLITTYNKGEKPMKTRVRQQGTEAKPRTKKIVSSRWVFGCSIVVASVVALNLIAEYSDFHDMARDYHHTLQDSADQRMQVLSLVTTQREK